MWIEADEAFEGLRHHGPPRKCHLERTVLEAKRRMTEKGNDILTVIDNQGRFCGVIQFESLSRKSEGNISEVMDQDIPTARERGDPGHFRDDAEREKSLVACR